MTSEVAFSFLLVRIHFLKARGLSNMTTKSDEDDACTEITVARAMKAFDVTVDALEDAVDRLRAEEAVSPGAVIKDLKEMNSAFTLALNLKEKARDAKRGPDGRRAGELDLDAARAEIGLRLACLRGVSDG